MSKKFQLIPFTIQVIPPTLTLPHTAPMVQRQVNIPGYLKWNVEKWDKAEFQMLEQKLGTLLGTNPNMEVCDFVSKLAVEIEKVLPEREFSVSIGSFSMEREAKGMGD